MKFTRYAIGLGSILVMSATITVNSSAGQKLRWATVMGVKQTGDQVGVGTGAVFGGAPWETLGGSVDIDLSNGKVKFNVQGLILSVGSVPSFGLTGVPIGTPGPVTQVKGTLVCDVDGTANGGDSVDIDTIDTALDAQGNAKFNGQFVSELPSLCTTDADDAFVIRIVQPSMFAGVWIAFGAVRSGG